MSMDPFNWKKPLSILNIERHLNVKVGEIRLPDDLASDLKIYKKYFNEPRTVHAEVLFPKDFEDRLNDYKIPQSYWNIIYALVTEVSSRVPISEDGNKFNKEIEQVIQFFKVFENKDDGLDPSRSSPGVHRYRTRYAVYLSQDLYASGPEPD